MNYIDSFGKDISSFFYESDLQMRQHLSDLITMCLNQIDDLMETVQNYEKSIEKFNEIGLTETTEFADFLKLLNEFYGINIHLLLTESDIFTAMKYLVVSVDDWEYRFFARRIYSLLYETKQSFIKIASELSQKLEKKLDIDAIKDYKQSIKNLNRLLRQNEIELESIRNKSEAHKDKDVALQIRLIENLSIEKSTALIEESIQLLGGVTKELTVLMNKLSSITQEKKNDLLTKIK